MERTETYPPITKRILDIINEKFNGNVRQFSMAMGLSNSAKINRLFKKDSRSGEYPTPSTDIIILISNTFDISTDWLLKGKDVKEHTNNININAHNVNGNENIVADGSTVSVNDVDSIVKATLALSETKRREEMLDTLLTFFNKMNNGK